MNIFYLEKFVKGVVTCLAGSSRNAFKVRMMKGGIEFKFDLLQRIL